MTSLRRGTALISVVAPAALLLSACGQDSFDTSGVIVQTLDSYSTCPLSGDEVVIMDAEGKDLAFGNLDSPEMDGSKEDDGTKWGTWIYECTYTFEITNIESGHDIYQMTIGGQYAPRQTEEELSSGIALTIG